MHAAKAHNMVAALVEGYSEAIAELLAENRQLRQALDLNGKALARDLAVKKAAVKWATEHGEKSLLRAIEEAAKVE